MNSKTEDLDLHDMLFILKRHIAIILILTLFGGLVSIFLVTFFIVPKYQADAQLIVNQSSMTMDAAQQYDAVELSQKEVDTYAIIIESSTILNTVISDLKLNTTKETLAKEIQVTGVGTTEVIDLKVTDENPDTAQAIVTDIINLAPSEIIRIVKAGSVEVISQPETNSKPVSPNKKLDTVIGFAIGLILSVLIAFVIEMLNNTCSSDEEVKRYLGFTVVGVIPNIDVKKGGTKKWQKNLRREPAAS